MLQSIADTQQAIIELDLVTREKFEQAFHAINRNFSEAFHTIFGGGTAEMRLTEVDSSGDAGIDVVASPPGKRLQNILLLSGGEKAMTALALLIAIFKYQPSPFCILDEVDAPLDEANVGRFTRLVGEMSSQTQFIIVTHNRKTMETGSVLYGVTMQEPGVSKLVSVRWEGDEAPKKTARRAAALLPQRKQPPPNLIRKRGELRLASFFAISSTCRGPEARSSASSEHFLYTELRKNFNCESRYEKFSHAFIFSDFFHTRVTLTGQHATLECITLSSGESNLPLVPRCASCERQILAALHLPRAAKCATSTISATSC